MGVGFISYAVMTPEFQAMSRPERAAAMERLKGQAAEHDVHMLVWGHPYGVNENLVIVYRARAEPGNVDIYASHGEMVALYKFYWLGIPPIRGNYRYLNGFILQFDEDAITAYANEGTR
jgi:hypothetical protein